MPKSYRIGVIADLHCGSRYAITPPGYRPNQGGPSGVFSDYMADCFAHFTKACPPLDCLIINGDCLEGEHPTLRSAPDALDTSPLRQVDVAVEVLSPLRAKSKALWLVRGTGFHEGKWCEALEALGQELKAEPWSKRRYSGEVLDGILGGVRFNVAHAQTSGAIYPGTLMNRTAWFANLAERMAKTVESDIIIRSHTHCTGKGEYMDKWVLSTRAWKLVNPHAVSKMEYYRAAALLDLGGHVLTLSPDGIMWREFKYAPYKADHRKLA
jgi:hypothetical protein